MPGDPALKIAGVVLAAGTSTRFGRNKLLLELGGESLVRRAARAALEGGLDPVVVVLGHEADRVGLELSGLPVRVVLNADYARGVNTSLLAGVGAVPTEAAAVVVLLADMPFVTGDMVARVLETYRQTRSPSSPRIMREFTPRRRSTPGSSFRSSGARRATAAGSAW